MPVPALSFATRYYNCNAGIMVTASHNPAKYNGYKAYGPDGCQMTDDAAAIVYAEIQKTDILTGVKYMPFAQGVEEGLIRSSAMTARMPCMKQSNPVRFVRVCVKPRTEARLQPTERIWSCTGYARIKRHRHH